MPLSFPRDMPVGAVATIDFNIQRVDFRSPEQSGRIAGVQAGFPLWRLEISLQNSDPDEGDEWITFLDSLRAAQRTFIGRDLSRLYPKAYPKGFAGLTRAGGGAFDGTATTWSVNTTGDVLTLHGLPAGFAIAKRDYVGFKYGSTSRALARFVEAGAADGSGDLSLTIEPPLPVIGDAGGVVPTDAVCHFDEPGCVMRLSPDETKSPQLDATQSIGGTVVGIQDLLS